MHDFPAAAARHPAQRPRDANAIVEVVAPIARGPYAWMSAALTAWGSEKRKTRDADAAQHVSIAFVQGALAHGADARKAKRERRASDRGANGCKR